MYYYFLTLLTVLTASFERKTVKQYIMYFWFDILIITQSQSAQVIANYKRFFLVHAATSLLRWVCKSSGALD
jgi:hypothetical protein